MNAPNRRMLVAEELKRKLAARSGQDMTDLYRRIKEGALIPIVGNALRNERIFDWWVRGEQPGGPSEATAPALPDSPTPTVDEYLAMTWADVIEYPLMDATNLAQVALYNRVRSRDDEDAKVRYLEFLKTMLLQAAASDQQAAALALDLEAQAAQCTFSELVTELGYPRFPPGIRDPLRCLAQMPLPIYLTTSYYDFLERALEAENRTPQVQMCFWSGEPANLLPEHQTQHDLAPTVENPVVFHLFGWERYPTTIALSEADYMDYLMRVVQDTDTKNPLLPLYLRGDIAASSLILLGYRPQDWDFRVLFRLIRQSALRPYSLLVQLDPDALANNLKSAEVRRYFEDFFRGFFTIQWGEPSAFVERLCRDYMRWAAGE